MIWINIHMGYMILTSFFSEIVWFGCQRKRKSMENLHGESISLLTVDMIWELFYLSCWLGFLGELPKNKPLAVVL